MPLPDAHALVIGIGAYAARPQSDVPETSADAAALAELLAERGYPRENVALLRDAGATRARILGALDGLAGRAGPDSTALIFLAGHGSTAGGSYFLPVYDTQYADGAPLSDGVVFDHELLAKLKALPSRRVLLILNTCHAGAVSPALGDAPEVGSALPAETSAALLGTGEGRVIITACREQQFSFVGPGPGTIVGRALLAALRGEGPGGALDAFALYLAIFRGVGRLVQAEVPADVRAAYGGAQEPELTVLKGVGPFTVALLPGASAPAEPPSAAAPPAEGAVRELEPADARQAFATVVGRGVAFGQGSRVTVGGDVVGGSVDSRSGIFIEGSNTITGGTMIGTVAGSVTVGGAGGPPQDPALPLALAQVRQAAAAARQRGEDDLADDLESAAGALQAALKAQAEGKADRRDSKLREAAASLQALAAGAPSVGPLAEAVARALAG